MEKLYLLLALKVSQNNCIPEKIKVSKLGAKHLQLIYFLFFLHFLLLIV